MPTQFQSQEVKSASKVVATVNTPVFSPIPGVEPDLSDPNTKAIVAGFIDAGQWLQENTEGANKLPGTKEGKVVNGLEYALSLITTQNATNMKNRERSAFNQAPSKQTFLNKAFEEFTSQPAQQMAQMAQEWAPKGGLPEWAKQRAAELEAAWKKEREERASAEGTTEDED